MAKKGFLAVSTLLLLVLITFTVQAERLVVINIPAFTLYLYDEGVPIREFPVSIGTELNPSVLGETTIVNKVEDPTYYPAQGGNPIPPGPENPVGTRWLGLGFSGYGIHGTNNPGSIGSPASSGCIRMFNEDVEELADLVQVGTPVKLIYQTVIIQEDPLLHTKAITVYPDVYKQGVSSAQLEEELDRLGWSGVFRPALKSLLKAPTEEPSALAWEWPLVLNSGEGELKSTERIAAEWNGKFFLPYDLPFDPRDETAFATVKWGEEYYLPLEYYLELTGLGCSLDEERLIFHSPTAYLGDKILGTALLFQNEVYLKGPAVSPRLMPTQCGAVIFWGEIYLPARLIVERELLGELRFVWPPEANVPTSCSWLHP
ncbi:MAG: L,D-transpeptidase [Firmicutes bacterium]|nr:L,D-transpeptidase [Bacillota bacterium]